ncbi:hypothetical protein P280DRAFT_513534 [Massarina eburnea CBS 473.64]|uniref:Uncharacterized protein n=1 Tax=Massarina eburnea CBS 473.64 TaxID=1395130 RepID=A0A6A6SGS6_9PLEO|nr:hypothetical protein P280DRAFT_513534 [Massarina eburnea CBS 473.64]
MASSAPSTPPAPSGDEDSTPYTNLIARHLANLTRDTTDLSPPKTNEDEDDNDNESNKDGNDQDGPIEPTATSNTTGTDADIDASEPPTRPWDPSQGTLHAISLADVPNEWRPKQLEEQDKKVYGVLALVAGFFVLGIFCIWGVALCR